MSACGVTNCFLIEVGFVNEGVARGLCFRGLGVNGRHKKAQPVQTRVGLFDGLRYAENRILAAPVQVLLLCHQTSFLTF